MKRLLTLAAIMIACLSTSYAATITPSSEVVPVESTQQLNNNQQKSPRHSSTLISEDNNLLDEASLYECCQTVTATLTDGEGNFASASSTFCSVQSCSVASSLASTMAQIKASQMLAQY